MRTLLRLLFSHCKYFQYYDNQHKIEKHRHAIRMNLSVAELINFILKENRLYANSEYVMR